MCNLHWCYTFCTGVTLFALVLHLNCTALSQSESSNFSCILLVDVLYSHKSIVFCVMYISFPLHVYKVAHSKVQTILRGFLSFLFNVNVKASLSRFSH